jgi:S-adenosylmethionine synthetase
LTKRTRPVRSGGVFFAARGRAHARRKGGDDGEPRTGGAAGGLEKATMARKDYEFTSESVSEGHPDKVCDRISDEIVDLFFREGARAGLDPGQIRVACEALATTNRVVIAGEVRGPKLGAEAIVETARKAVKDIGYEQDGFHWRKAKVEVLLHAQSADIAQGVDRAGDKDEGAGDQGIMFGYACRETPELMPAPIYYAHKILREIARARHGGGEKVLGPDAKSQVTVRYVKGKPVEATQIVVSHQHLVESLTSKDVAELVRPYVEAALPAGWITDKTVWHINPTGKFFIGGPDGDCGLTGRKIIVDTYGGSAPHGGGAFSGKDPSKVDRSAAYAARYLAKNVVAAGLADRCTIQLSYAIGVARPLSIYADLHGTGKVDESKLEKALQEVMNLSPRGIREHLKLSRPIFARTAAYGHFGRAPEDDGGFSWEKTDLVESLRGLIK